MKCRQCQANLDKKNKICPVCGYDNSYAKRLGNAKIPKELRHLSVHQLEKHIQMFHFLKEKNFWVGVLIVFVVSVVLFNPFSFFRKNRSKVETVHNFHDDLVEETSMNAYGNSMGNIINGGTLVSYGNDVYIASNAEVYRVSLALDRMEKIADKQAKYFNVIQDTLYFIDVSNQNTVCSYGLKSHEKKTLPYQASSLMTVGNYLYYLDAHGSKAIHQVKSDLSEDRTLTQSDCISFNIVGDWLYYSTKEGIYKTPIMGGEVTKCVDGIYANFVIANQMIYFIDHHGDLYRMKLDGSQVTQMVDGMVNSFIVTERYLFYADYDSGIYKKSLETGELTQLTTGRTKSLQLASSWIYYQLVDTEEGCFVSVDENSDIKVQLFDIKK